MKDFTRPEISGWIKRKLGDGVLPVELTPEQLEDAIEDSLDGSNRSKPLIKIGTIATGASAGSSDPLADARPSGGSSSSSSGGGQSLRFKIRNYGRGIFEVSTGTNASLMTLSSMFGFPIPLESQTFDHTFERYEAYLMWSEEVKRVMSATFEWRWVEPFLYLTNIPTNVERIFYSYWDQADLHNVPVAWRKWIRDYALALSKGTLARIRGKFQNIPSPGGGVQLDAQDLQSQSEMEQEKLLEKLGNSRGDFLPPTFD